MGEVTAAELPPWRCPTPLPPPGGGPGPGTGARRVLRGRTGSGHALRGLLLCVLAAAGKAFKRNLSDLRFGGTGSFSSLCFEKKCPTGLHGTPPNLDVFMDGGDGVVAVESKCTEYLWPYTARFSMFYRTSIRDARRWSTSEPSWL